MLFRKQVIEEDTCKRQKKGGFAQRGTDQNEEHTSKELQINSSASTAPAGNHNCETQSSPVKGGCSYA